MRRITYWTLCTISAVVLLFGYRTSTQGALGAGGTLTGGTTATPAGTTQKSTGTSTGTSRAKGVTGTKTVTGGVAQTLWGPVQVQLTIVKGRITKATAIQYPNGNPRDAQINGYALPILMQETLSAQSAQIQMVSGATITSGGYLQSLQSALDQAKA